MSTINNSLHIFFFDFTFIHLLSNEFDDFLELFSGDASRAVVVVKSKSPGDLFFGEPVTLLELLNPNFDVFFRRKLPSGFQ